MCLILYLPDGTEVTDELQLTAAVNRSRPDLEMRASDPPDPCLCRFNLEKVAAVVGWRIEWKNGDAYATRRCDA